MLSPGMFEIFPLRVLTNQLTNPSFPSEVFVIVSLTLFLPICLEQFARDNGYLLPLRTERCSAAVVVATDNSTRTTTNMNARMSMTMDARAPGTTTTTPSSDAATRRCVVKIAGVWIDTASFRWVFVFVQDSVSFVSFLWFFLLDCGERI